MENQLPDVSVQPTAQSSRVKIFVILFVAVVCLITGVFVYRSLRTSTVSSSAPELPAVFANQDADLDGLTDSEENDLGTDPQNLDSDNDGLSDGYEAKKTGTDPKNPHSKDAKLTDSEWLIKDTPRR